MNVLDIIVLSTCLVLVLVGRIMNLLALSISRKRVSFSVKRKQNKEFQSVSYINTTDGIRRVLISYSPYSTPNWTKIVVGQSDQSIIVYWLPVTDLEQSNLMGFITMLSRRLTSMSVKLYQGW